MRDGIHIGSDKESIKAARTMIMDILRASVDNQTKQVALNVLQSMCSINGTMITHCMIDGGGKVVKTKE